LVFIVVVRNTMEVGDCLGGSGACPTVSGVALGVACAGGLLALACVLIGRARKARRLIRQRDELLVEISGLPFGSKQRADKHREVAPIEDELDEYLF
jgi:hypothetical protein